LRWGIPPAERGGKACTLIAAEEVAQAKGGRKEAAGGVVLGKHPTSNIEHPTTNEGASRARFRQVLTWQDAVGTI